MPVGSGSRGTIHTPLSGAVGNVVGRVENVAPLHDRDVIMDGDLQDLTGVAQWAVQGDDTVNLVENAAHILGRTSLAFDKFNGLDNTVFAGFQRADAQLDLSRFLERDLVMVSIYISDLTNVANVHLRLGTDAANYDEWTWADTVITAGVWNHLSIQVGDATMVVTGNGWDPENVKYVALLVEFDLETNALADIRVDSIRMQSSQGDVFGTDMSADLESLRVLSVAANALLTTINTAVQLIDNMIGTIGAAHGTDVSVIGMKAETTVPAAVADGEAVAAWGDEYGRLVQLFTDLATQTAMVTDASPAKMQKAFEIGWAAHVAPGDVTAAVNVRDYDNILVSYVIATIDTSVDLIIWGSLDDGVTYHPIWADTILAADDQDDVVSFTGMALTNVYCEFDAEVGGAAAVVTWQLGVGN